MRRLRNVSDPKMSRVVVTYGASVTAPHPNVSFANAKPTLEISAECDEAERDKVFAQLKDWVHAGLNMAVRDLYRVVEHNR